MSPEYYWTFNSNDLTSLGSVDLTGHLTDYGNYTFNAGTFSPSASGNMGPDISNYITFSGSVTQGWRVTNNTAVFDDKNFTITAWVRLPKDNLSKENTILFAGSGGTNASKVHLYVSTNGAARADITNTAGVTQFVQANNMRGYKVVQDGLWHCIQLIVNAGAAYLYVDGLRTAPSTTLAGSIGVDSHGKFIGRDANDTNAFRFLGDLAHVSISNYATVDSNHLEVWRSGGETYPYDYMQRMNYNNLAYSGNPTSNSNPLITTSSSYSSGTTTGTFEATTGLNLTAAPNPEPRGFGFDRVNYLGVEKTPQGFSMFGGTTSWWMVHAWIKVSTFNGFSTIFRNSGGGGTDQVLMRIRGNDQSTPGVLEAYVGGKTLYGTTRIDNDAWHHVMLQWQNGTIRIYVDGVQQASISTSGQTTSFPSEATSNLKIGRGDGTSPDERFIGLLDELYFARPTVSHANAYLITDKLSADYTRFGNYQRALLSNPNVTLPADPMIASNADLIDVTVTADRQVDYPADPMTATALMIDATVTIVNYDVYFSAPALTANATMPDPTIIGGTGVSVSWGTANASTLMINPSTGIAVNVKSYGAAVVDLNPRVYLPFDGRYIHEFAYNYGSFTGPITIGASATGGTGGGDPGIDYGGAFGFPNCELVFDGNDYIEFYDAVSTPKTISFYLSVGIFDYPQFFSVGNLYAYRVDDSDPGNPSLNGFWRSLRVIFPNGQEIKFPGTANTSFTGGHIVITVGNGEGKVYVNGNLVGTVSTPNITGSLHKIGTSPSRGGIFDMDEYSEFDYVLSAEQIRTQLYSPNKWKFNLHNWTSEFVEPTIIAGTGNEYFWPIMTVTASMVNAVASTTSTIDYAAEPATATCEMVDPVISTQIYVDIPVNASTASAEMVNPTIYVEIYVDVPADPATASAEMIEPIISTTSTVDFAADPMLADADGEDVIIITETNFEFLANHAEASALFVMPTVIAEINIDVLADVSIATAEMVHPTVEAIQNVDMAADPATAMAEFVNALVSIDENLSVAPMIVIDAEFGSLINVFTETVINAAPFVITTYMPEATVLIGDGYVAEPMIATMLSPQLVRVQNNYTWPQENRYSTKIRDLGAEFYIAKSIAVNDTWTDYNVINPQNYVFGALANVDAGTGSTITASAVLTCNGTKWGGVLNGSASAFMNFYPQYDRNGNTAPTSPTVAQLVGNEDWRYNEYTGPWFYTTTEDSYELIFSTTASNQIIMSGQTTYAIEDERGTDTFEDDNRINTYIEYGLNQGKLYVKYYPSLQDEPIIITGNVNVADGQDHHIVMQRTSASGMYRERYRLNTNIGAINQWSIVTTTTDRHAVVGQQEALDKFYADPITGEIFHGFEIWVDGELDVRSASFNSTHIAPIVKSLGGRTTVVTGQAPGGGAIRIRRSEQGFTGTLTSIVGRFNTESINALSSYTYDYADMPRFPQEAKIIKHAAIDPPTIKQLAALALYEANIQSVDAANASAELIQPTVSTNVKKILRLYWTADQTVGTNFGTSANAEDIVVDTYSVLYQLSNNPSHVYNVDAALRDGMTDPETAAKPVVINRWKDANGIDRLFNINTDINLDEYNTIIFMDYPDNSDEIDAVLPNNNFVYIEDQMNQFINRLKTAVANGKSLYVSSPTLAIKLGIIKAETVVTQTYDANDTVSASINPFNALASTKYFDTHRNNKYEIVKEIAGITDVASYTMVDAIAYERGLNDEYHLKYENKANGLKIGDQMIIPGLPLLPSQLNKDYAGYINNRITNLHVITETDILSGEPVAKLSGTNYVTTLVLRPGDFIGSTRIAGRVFVNFVEDALTMGLDEYNYAIIQTGLTSGKPDENKETIKWNYSTSRTTRKLAPATNVISNTGIYGQTSPTNGGGGPIVQAPTSSTFGNIRVDHDSNNETFISSIYFDASSEKYSTEKVRIASMTFRGINWLTSYSYNNVTNVGVDVMTGSVESGDSIATLEFSTSKTVTPMYAGFALLPPAEDGKSTMVIRPLPEFADASMVNLSTVVAKPMTAAAMMKENLDALWIGGNIINLTIHELEKITLYIQKEVN